MLPAVAQAPAQIPDFPGVVTARNTQIVPAAFQGRVERVHIFAGQKVHAGDPIAKLDDTDIRANIEATRNQERAAMSDAASAGAQAHAINLRLQQESKLQKRGYASIQSVNNIKGERGSIGSTGAAAAARAEAHKAERVRLEGLAAKATVTAPFDGVVMMVKVKEGEVAQSGTQIARVFDPKDLIMKFAVPKEHRHLVAPGKRVELRIEGVERPVWATIERIADEEPPLNFAVVEADIDDSKLSPDEVRVTAQGRVRIADASAGGKR